MKITVHRISIIQCSEFCAAAILVAGSGRLSCLTEGPPGRSFTACAAVANQTLAHAPARHRLDASLLLMFFIVFSCL